ncbi:MAG: nickel-dependent lactate racemase [Clostridiaceae bacterium]|jgi:nickel-dependent lactate racemase|nr:nickel-dependent lactate racemase [Clostridiaceae bacterium]
MHFRYGFGKTFKEFDIDDKNVMVELKQNSIERQLINAEEVRRSLENPIGSKRLSKIVKPGESIVIITSDITRPMPSKIVLPPLLDELSKAGVSLEDITIVFALGSHRKHTEDEMKYLVGEETYKKVKCLDSDVKRCRMLGTTSRGTPVEIFDKVADADRVICLGNIEFHYFAGYSGGVKAIMPGVSTRAAIQANHSAMVRDSARAGAIDDNPVRQDIEEVVKFRPVDFILNVVLDENKTIIKAVAGHHVLAHQEGCRFLDSLYKINIPARADIVITTPGGFPKDINLYQAQKALDNAKHAVRGGGIIILLAACTEGYGESVFERWINESSCPEDLVMKIKENFELGGHKAAAIALVEKKARVFIVSNMPRQMSKKLYMEPFDSMEEALSSAFSQLGQDASVLLMPHGGSTLPVSQCL